MCYNMGRETFAISYEGEARHENLLTEMHFGAGVAAWSYIPEETGKLHLQ